MITYITDFPFFNYANSDIAISKNIHKIELINSELADNHLIMQLTINGYYGSVDSNDLKYHLRESMIKLLDEICHNKYYLDVEMFNNIANTHGIKLFCHVYFKEESEMLHFQLKYTGKNKNDL